MLQPKNAGNRFYFPDEKHEEYIEGLFDRSLNHKESVRTKKYIPVLTEDDKSLILEFITEIQATCHITSKRKFKYAYILVHWREFIGEFRKNTIADLHNGINKIQLAKDEIGCARYAKGTLTDYVQFLKKFYLWMIEEGYSTIPEKKVRAIKPPKPNTMTKTAEMLLSEDDIKKLIEACQNSRDRAIIAMLYEGGFRMGEIATLRWDQVEFNDWNVVINVNFKTNKPRYIPLVMARSYLAQWKQDYPLPLSPNGFVFVTAGRHEQLQYRGFVKQLEKIVRRAGIEKPITPHLFRHSRITHLITKGVSESIIKKMMWGDINSKMFATYAHLTNTDTDNEIAKLAGIITPDKKKASKALEPRQCKRCYTINAPTVRFCAECGLSLTGEASDKLKETKEQLYLQMNLSPERQALLDEVITKLMEMPTAES
jgi:site-specific recombinase XerD